MKFSYNWLQSFFNKKLPKPKKLAEVLSMQFAEVEEVKKFKQDWVLDIDIKPNRAGDCFSHFGLAREISAILNYQLEKTSSRPLTDKNLRASDFVKVLVENKTACPRYTARVIVGVKVSSSPKWLTERLAACGLRPINNIVDATNYVMLETGQPLHAFDADKITKGKIIVRLAKPGEKIVALDGQKYTLDKDILVIAGEKKPIALAGVKGGQETEIDSQTRTIILEAANFNSQAIRKSSRKLNLRTDASLRFEHGLDTNLTETAINRACFLLEKLAQGKTASGLVDFYPDKVLPKKIKLNLSLIEKMLGIKIPRKEVIRILKKLGLKVISSKLEMIELEVPTFRLDISIEEDLVEEIGRIFSYQKIPTVFPSALLIPPKRNNNIFWQDFARDFLKEAGFSEVFNYSFFGEKEAAFFSRSKEKLIELANPLSREHRYLRTSLIPGLLKNTEKNFKDFNQLKFFESGKVFQSPLPEKTMLAGLILNNGFYSLKGTVDLLLGKMGIKNFYYAELGAGSELSDFWHPKKSAEIKIGRQGIGFLGEISPLFAQNFEIKGKIVLFELDFGKLSQLASEKKEFQPISRFPAAFRDIAVLVPQKTKTALVLSKIYSQAGKIIQKAELFDVYQGKEISAGKKNLAFRIVYQAQDRTLTAAEIDEVQQKIIKSLETEPDWQVRK